MVSERRFLEWIGKAVPDSVHKTYSADQLAALSKLSSDMIRELAQFGLLDERGGRFGFRDLASARQIAKLLADGVRLSEIIRGVSEIRKWLPEVGLANVRLHPGTLNSLEVEQLGGRTDKRGQFVLAVEEFRHNADDLFEQAQSAEEAGDIAEAERLYRLLMKSDPTDASAPFNLGNMLRAYARNVEGEAALRAATRADPTFAVGLGTILATCWMNRDAPKPPLNACATLYGSRPTTRMPCSTSRCCYNEKNQYAEASDYWRRYLAADRQSEWAARARRSLKFWEMQVRLVASA